jgi:hypothetical protein
MSLGKGFLFAGLACFAMLTSLAMGGDVVPSTDSAQSKTATAEKAKPAAESVDQLIQQLDDSEYAAREAACGKLATKGKEAIPALEKAAANGNLEVSSRATTVLGKLLKSSNEPTQQAATEALQRLSEGDSPAAARKAKSILEKKDGMKNNAPGLNGGGIVVPGGNGFGQIIINGGVLKIGGGGAMKTMSVKNVNGVKEINVSEDGKTVKIEDDPGKGIKVELTEKVNGKEVTKKYSAKNAEELKKKQPAGYEIYKKYASDQGGNGALQLQIQAGGLMPAMPAMPAIPLQPALPLLPNPGQAVPAPAQPAATAQSDNRQVEVATSLVKHLSARLDQLQKAQACKTASPESKAELKKQINELSKRIEGVRGQLGDK